ncbi:LCP family protein [Knoellia sp. 3-2P3]|uniref:LCP family protein n=1 Tax=unclassified Knoellia TaxID=2618719 RepID=UPI0023DAD272|nr:LCP family protein [Knoellia sp. 3-2P3]MDF2093151.1 LCP family protein [Knoellia sp. 3-2P3]
MSRPPAALERDAEVSVYVSGRPDRRLADPESMGPRTRRRRAFALVLLTLAFPGSAQLAAGSRTVGRVAVRCWLGLWALALFFGLLFLVNRGWFLGLFGRAWFLTVLQWALLGFALFWGALFLDAWRLGQPGRLVLRARRWLTGLTAGLLVVTSGGLVYAASNVAAGKDALNALFSGNRAVEPTDGRYNILLLGGDTGKSRVGTRPDSIQLASIDAETGRAVVFGFSRDMENIDFRPGSVMQRLMPEGWNCGDECLLNGLYTWAEDHRDQFPAGTQSAGVLATREAVEAVSGLDVHYYAMVDLRGFRKMVDAVGGLDITVQRRTPIGGGTSPVVGWIEPGRQHLDGYHALWYARSRHGSTNYERMARQRCVMTALVDQVDPQTVLTRFPKIAGASSGLVRTDLPQSELGYFADLALKTRTQKIKSVNFVPPLIKPWDYDADFVRRTVRSTIAASEKSPEKPRTKATARPASAAPRTPKPAAPAATSVPAKPAADPATAGGQASEADLSAVCSS